MALEPFWTPWMEVTSPGNVLAPERSLKAQLVAVGAGGGGRGGWFNQGGRGAGGRAGQWSSAEIDVSPGQAFWVTIGQGGAGGKGGTISNNQPGGASGAATTIGPVTAPGGASGPAGRIYEPGKSPGTYTMFGRDFVGGAERAGDGAFEGNAPGGGGAPGAAGGFLGNGTPGGNGARGQAWCRFLVTPPLPAGYGKPGAITVGDSVIESLHFEGAEIEELWLNGVLVWGGGVDIDTVTIAPDASARDQIRAALSARGLDYQTVEELPFLLDTSNVTSMSYMFSGCSALTSVPDMDTSNVTNMFSMFGECSALTSVPDMDTSNVTSMTEMFYRCSALTSVPDMDTSNVTSVSRMFSGCSALRDGKVRLIGKKSEVSTYGMIDNSGLTLLPFYDINGDWTG